jgi:hypothetical protein
MCGQSSCHIGCLSVARTSLHCTQAAQSESPSHPAIVSTTFPPHSSLQLRKLNNRVLSAEYTAFEEQNSFHRTASAETGIMDRSVENTGYRDKTLDVSVAHNGQDASMCVSNLSFLPSHISSASISPSPPASIPSPLAEHEPISIWREETPRSLYARRTQRLDYLHPEVQKHIASIIELGDHFLWEDVIG